MANATDLEVVEEFLATVNRHDIEKALSMLADDFVFRDVDSSDGMDKEEMKHLFEWDSEIDSQAQHQPLKVDQDGTIFGVFAESNQLYAQLGLDKTLCLLRFRIEDGKIAEQIIDQAPSPGPTFEEALEPFFLWAELEAPEELDAIQPDGHILFTREMAKKWMALLTKWKAAQG